MIDTLLPQSVQQEIEFFVLSKVAISYYILNYRAGERNFALYAIRHKHLDIRSDASKRQTYIHLNLSLAPNLCYYVLSQYFRVWDCEPNLGLMKSSHLD